MNWTDLGIPSLIVLITGGLLFWHHRIMQSTIKKMEVENNCLTNHVGRLKEELATSVEDNSASHTNVESENNVMVFPTPSGGGYNRPFYDYFIQQITNANRNIVITGDGFECLDEEGREVARLFIEAFRVALNKGVSIVRIETKSRGRVEWASMLADLVTEYGERFSLYLLRNKNSFQMASVCVIDPDSIPDSVVEIMLSTKQLLGVKAGDLAGTAVFLHGQPYLAQDLQERVLALTNTEYTHNPITSLEVVNTLAGEDYYFSFGSNMKEQQMVDRCHSAKKIGVGFLQDHEIVFNRKGSYRPGGVASVQHKEGSRVYGVIWQINSAELIELDEDEDLTAYRRFEENIKTLAGKTYKSHIYKAIPQGIFPPDPDYLELMIEAAHEQELPPEYIEHLETFKEQA